MEIFEIKQQLDNIYGYLDRCQNEKAEQILLEIWDEYENNPDFQRNPLTQYYNFGCCLVDTGSDNNNQELINRGLYIFEKYKEQYIIYMPIHQYEYNLGNAYRSQYDISKNINKIFSLDTIDLLNMAKSHYWKAFNSLINDLENKQYPELLINLATTFSNSCRIAEALQLYDIVLNNFPIFIEALLNKSKCLEWLSRISYIQTKRLQYLRYECLTKALQNENLTTNKRARCENELKLISNSFEDEHILIEEILKDNIKTKEEYNKLSSYRKFCLNNFLSLSEHGLYCWCNGARRDDLTIPLVNKPIIGDFVPRMELLLNRVKSEYSFARRMFYESIMSDSEENMQIDTESCFTDLKNSESVGIRIEKLRSSFRICYGILDKIAVGICEIFNIQTNKNILFESFWKNKSINCWDIIKDINNPGLIGLYSIASDLNTKDGELKFYKELRNSLEHEMIVIKANEYDSDLYKSYQSKQTITITYNEFTDKTKRILQIVRSAIFCFVFCVRHKAMKNDSDDEQFIKITLDKK